MSWASLLLSSYQLNWQYQSSIIGVCCNNSHSRQILQWNFLKGFSEWQTWESPNPWGHPSYFNRYGEESLPVNRKLADKHTYKHKQCLQELAEKHKLKKQSRFYALSFKVRNNLISNAIFNLQSELIFKFNLFLKSLISVGKLPPE